MFAKATAKLHMLIEQMIIFRASRAYLQVRKIPPRMLSAVCCHESTEKASGFNNVYSLITTKTKKIISTHLSVVMFPVELPVREV